MLLVRESRRRKFVGKEGEAEAEFYVREGLDNRLLRLQVNMNVNISNSTCTSHIFSK